MACISDHGQSKKVVFESIFLNKRLEYYKFYLRLAKQRGYQVISLEDFYRLEDKRGSKHFILRHDVDHQGRSTRKMFEAEQECGVNSTWYFRFSTIDTDLIEDILDAGSQVGFHFETISAYIKQNKCKSRDEIDIGKMRTRFYDEVLQFENAIGHKVSSCCSHGDDINKAFAISNNNVTEGLNLCEYGLLFEAYEADLYENYIDCHIMDGNIRKNYGFAYPDMPINTINHAVQNIVFLSHPHNWHLSFWQRVRGVAAIILGQVSFSTNRTFIRIK